MGEQMCPNGFEKRVDSQNKSYCKRTITNVLENTAKRCSFAQNDRNSKWRFNLIDEKELAFEANKEESVNNCINTGKLEHECHKIVDELAAAAVARGEWGTFTENITEGEFLHHCDSPGVQCYFQLDNPHCASTITLTCNDLRDYTKLEHLKKMFPKMEALDLIGQKCCDEITSFQGEKYRLFTVTENGEKFLFCMIGTESMIYASYEENFDCKFATHRGDQYWKIPENASSYDIGAQCPTCKDDSSLDVQKWCKDAAKDGLCVKGETKPFMLKHCLGTCQKYSFNSIRKEYPELAEKCDSCHYLEDQEESFNCINWDEKYNICNSNDPSHTSVKSKCLHTCCRKEHKIHM